MTMRPLSEALDSVLLGLGIDAGTAGTGRASGKGAGRAGKSAHPRAAGREEEAAAVRLVWTNPTMRKRRSEGSRPLLMIVCK
jgi:hypothetical protein